MSNSGNQPASLATHNLMPCLLNTGTECAKRYVPNSQRPWLSPFWGCCDFCIMSCCDVTLVDVCVTVLMSPKARYVCGRLSRKTF